MKIVFASGTRADFGKLEPIILEFKARGHAVFIFATGMHQMAEFGLTKVEVHNRFGDAVYDFVNQSPGDPHEKILQNTISGFEAYVNGVSPDLVFVHGDRIEAFAVCTLCAMRQIAVAHIEGGEVSGSIDEIYRHCNSKLSSLHFVSSDDAARRVRLMGESEQRIFQVGSPEFDLHAGADRPRLAAVLDHYGIDFDDYGIVIFHSVISEADDMVRQFSALLDGLEASQKNFVMIKPNNDPGYLAISKTLNALKNPRIRILPSMRFSYFSTLLECAKIVIGNSSLGVREAPFFGIASIDIGTRQTARAYSTSVIPLGKDALASLPDLIHKHWAVRYAPSSHYGNGGAAKKIVDIIETGILQTLPQQKFYQEPLNG